MTKIEIYIFKKLNQWKIIKDSEINLINLYMSYIGVQSLKIILAVMILASCYIFHQAYEYYPQQEKLINYFSANHNISYIELIISNKQSWLSDPIFNNICFTEINNDRIYTSIKDLNTWKQLKLSIFLIIASYILAIVLSNITESKKIKKILIYPYTSFKNLYHRSFLTDPNNLLNKKIDHNNIQNLNFFNRFFYKLLKKIFKNSIKDIESLKDIYLCITILLILAIGGSLLLYALSIFALSILSTINEIYTNDIPYGDMLNYYIEKLQTEQYSAAMVVFSYFTAVFCMAILGWSLHFSISLILHLTKKSSYCKQKVDNLVNTKIDTLKMTKELEKENIKNDFFKACKKN